MAATRTRSRKKPAPAKKKTSEPRRATPRSDSAPPAASGPVVRRAADPVIADARDRAADILDGARERAVGQAAEWAAYVRDRAADQADLLREHAAEEALQLLGSARERAELQRWDADRQAGAARAAVEVLSRQVLAEAAEEAGRRLGQAGEDAEAVRAEGRAQVRRMRTTAQAAAARSAAGTERRAAARARHLICTAQREAAAITGRATSRAASLTAAAAEEAHELRAAAQRQLAAAQAEGKAAREQAAAAAAELRGRAEQQVSEARRDAAQLRQDAARRAEALTAEASAEAGRLLEEARTGAEQRRSAAEDAARSCRQQAHDEARQLRAEAAQDAERVRSGAAAEAKRIRDAARAEAADAKRLLAQARTDAEQAGSNRAQADALREQAQQVLEDATSRTVRRARRREIRQESRAKRKQARQQAAAARGRRTWGQRAQVLARAAGRFAGWCRKLSVTQARRVLVAGPIAAPMAVAWWSQMDYAQSAFGWAAIFAVGFAAAWELTTAFTGWMYHQARKVGDGGLLYRVFTWIFASGAAAMNYAHHCAPDGSPTQAAVAFSTMSIVGMVLWELYASLVHRKALRDKGLAAEARPRIGVIRWMRYTRHAWTAWSLAITDASLSTLDRAWSAAETELARRAVLKAARAGRPLPSSYRVVPVSASLTPAGLPGLAVQFRGVGQAVTLEQVETGTAAAYGGGTETGKETETSVSGRPSSPVSRDRLALGAGPARETTAGPGPAGLSRPGSRETGKTSGRAWPADGRRGSAGLGETGTETAGLAFSGPRAGTETSGGTTNGAGTGTETGGPAPAGGLGSIETEIGLLMDLMRSRGGPDKVSLDTAIAETKRPKSTAAKRLAAARDRYSRLAETAQRT